MKQLKYADGNIFKRVDGRGIGPQQMPYPLFEQNGNRTLQMHSSLVQRLSLEKTMEGHQGCVNALAWNAKGTLLVSGSDDTRVNIWSYASRKLLHSIDTGHSTNIFCTKFVPETGDEVLVSGAGDAEVRVFRLVHSIGRCFAGATSSEQTALFRCHSKRVKKLAVEGGNPHVVWSASEDGTLRQHDLRESVLCPTVGSRECRNVLLDLRSGAKKTLADPPRHCLALKSCAISPTRPHQLLVGGSDAFARLYDRRMLPPCSTSRQQTKPPSCVCYFCPAHLSDYGRSSLHLTHVTFSPNGQEVLLSYSGEHVYLMDATTGNVLTCCTETDFLFVVGVSIVALIILFQQDPVDWDLKGMSPSICQHDIFLEEDSVPVLQPQYQLNPRMMQVVKKELQKLLSADFIYPISDSQGSTVTYEVDDIQKRPILAPNLNEAKPTLSPQLIIDNGYFGSRKSSTRLKECKELLEDARKALEEGHTYLYVIEATSDVLDAGGPEVGPVLRHDCLITRAAAFLRRLWKNDVHMAIRDLNEALVFNPMSVWAHHNMAEALSQLGRHKEALDYAMHANALDPTNNELAESIRLFRGKLAAAEEAKFNRNSDGESKIDRRPSRIRSLSELLFRSDPDQSDSSQDSRRAEREYSDFDDDMDVEMEIEMSVSGDDERGRESSFRPESLSLRLRRRGHPGTDGNQRNSSTGSLPSAVQSDNVAMQVEIATDVRQRYVGHCNVGTDIKQASFLGEKGDFVASGSDDGRWFVWQKKTGRLIKMFVGDENVVNCVQCHPFDCAVVTSGIDNTIKMWTPCEKEPSIRGSDAEDMLNVMAENQHGMHRHREIGLPLEILQRFRMHEVAEGTVHPFECTQS